jgi:hypothetical protein
MNSKHGYKRTTNGPSHTPCFAFSETFTKHPISSLGPLSSRDAPK